MLWILFSFAMADTGTFELSGLHCGGCQKAIEKKVCSMEGLESCTVELVDTKAQTGRLTLRTKEGVKLDPGQVTTLVQSAGKKFKVTSQTVK